MDKILYHGSNVIVEKPVWGVGNPRNDYGLGFYCTENLELSKEWSCRDLRGGFSNKYSLCLDGLNILDLSAPPYGILHWLAILTKYRVFSLTNQIAFQGRTYLQDNYLPKLSDYDVITGYRADDSYFSFAEDFLSNSISITQLNKALKLGNLGEQIVLKSQKAFKIIKYNMSEPVDGTIYYEKRICRDTDARNEYSSIDHSAVPIFEDRYLIDIMREERRTPDGSL